MPRLWTMVLGFAFMACIASAKDPLDPRKPFVREEIFKQVRGNRATVDAKLQEFGAERESQSDIVYEVYEDLFQRRGNLSVAQLYEEVATKYRPKNADFAAARLFLMNWLSEEFLETKPSFAAIDAWFKVLEAKPDAAKLSLASLNDSAFLVARRHDEITQAWAQRYRLHKSRPLTVNEMVERTAQMTEYFPERADRAIMDSLSGLDRLREAGLAEANPTIVLRRLAERWGLTKELSERELQAIIGIAKQFSIYSKTGAPVPWMRRTLLEGLPILEVVLALEMERRPGLGAKYGNDETVKAAIAASKQTGGQHGLDRTRLIELRNCAEGIERLAKRLTI